MKLKPRMGFKRKTCRRSTVRNQGKISMKKIIIHDEAERELWHAVDYYEDKVAGLGLDFEYRRVRWRRRGLA